jgi:multidrug efflux system membrane fusion protein
MIKPFIRDDQKLRRLRLLSHSHTGTLFVLIALVFFTACSTNGKPSEVKAKSGIREAVPVTVGTVVRKTVPIQLTAVGNVQAYSTVSVKAQVNGELKRVYFTEGQYVKKGELLFTIDPRPFEATLKQAEANLAKNMAQLKQAEANLARDTAQMNNAEVEAQRYATLLEKGVVAKQQYDQMHTAAEAYKATVNADRAAIENAQAAIGADKAAIENAKIQLGYCSIRSPMDGRTGNLIVNPGNIVKATDTTPLVVINQISPIYVLFSVPEQTLPEIKKYMASGTLEVDALISKDGNQQARGELTFVDNTVDAATGTIRLKATFPNKDRVLWPGQFVNVVLTLSTQPNAIVVPSQAVQIGQQGQLVFVVKPDLTVESRPVAVARTLGLDTVIEKGLEAGERVVTDGQLRLVPGAKVEIKGSPPTPTP